MSAADAAIRRGPGARPQRDLPVPLLTHGVESSNQTCRIGRRCMTLKTLHDAPNNPTKAINVKRLDKTKPWRRISRRSNRPLNPTCAKQPSPVAKCRRPPRPAVGAPRIGRRHSIFQASARQERWQQAAHGRLYPIDLKGEKRVSARRNAQGQDAGRWSPTSHDAQPRTQHFVLFGGCASPNSGRRMALGQQRRGLRGRAKKQQESKETARGMRGVKGKRSREGAFQMGVRRRPAFAGKNPTIIGAGAFHDPVRDGKGWCRPARAV